MSETEKKVQLILECNKKQAKELILNETITVKYELPSINSYVVELYEKDLPKIKNLDGLKSVYENTRITAQMDNARKILKADFAEKEGYTGKDVTIAFLDTGIAPLKDFTFPNDRIIYFKDFVNNKQTTNG